MSIKYLLFQVIVIGASLGLANAVAAREPADFDAVIVGAGPLGRQTVLEIYRRARDRGLRPPRVLLVDGGDAVSGVTRWTSTGLSVPTVANLALTGIRFVDGENATARPRSTTAPLVPPDHSVEAQLPEVIVPKQLQATFPDLLATYDPVFERLTQETGGAFVHVLGRVPEGDPAALRDTERGFMMAVDTPTGRRWFRGTGVLLGADGFRSVVRQHLGVEMSGPLDGHAIPETIVGVPRRAGDRGPPPGSVGVWWKVANLVPGGSVLYKTEHDKHLLSTRATGLDRAGRIALLAQIAGRQGIRGPLAHVSHFLTSYKRVDDAVRVGGASGGVFAVAGEAAVGSSPLGGFGANIMLSVIAPAAGRLVCDVVASDDPRDRARAARRFRDLAEDAASKHHARTYRKWLHMAGIRAPRGVELDRPLPLARYPFSPASERAAHGELLTFTRSHAARR